MTDRDEPETWSYATVLIGNLSIASLDKYLNAIGADGWELVVATSQVKSLLNVTGNSLVFVFKKRGAGHRAPEVDPQFSSETPW